MEKVSIICAVRNEERTLAECLKSLLNQTYKNTEIIVVNDGSTDRSRVIAEEFVKKSEKIKLIDIEYASGGCVRPRIIGINNSSGSILFVVDADAYYEKDYLEKCLKHINEEKVGGVIGKIRVWNPKTFISKYRDIQYRLRWDNVENMNAEIAAGKIAAWIFKKKIYDEFGGYDEKMLYGDDINFARKLLKAGYKIVYDPAALWYHRWKEYPLEVIANNFEIGKQNYALNKRRKEVIAKVIYFLLPIPIIFLSTHYLAFVFLLVLHMLPMFVRGIGFFIKSNSKYRKYALLSPLVAYISNIPFSVSFVIGFLKEDVIHRFK